MNQEVIRQGLLILGLSPHKFSFGWYLGDVGPCICLLGRPFVAPLPIDDEADFRFAKFVFDSSQKTDEQLIAMSAENVP